MDQSYVKIDGIKWFIWADQNNNRIPQPLCPEHNLRMKPLPDSHYSIHYDRMIPDSLGKATKLECAEGPHIVKIPRKFDEEKQYVIDRMDAKIFAKLKFINLDDEALPIAEDKVPKNSEYFVTSLLTQSKVGLRLVVYAGKRGSSNKTQIFVEPEIKRLAFDQKDLHPADVFTMLEAIFEDGTKTKIEKSGGDRNGTESES